MIKERKVRQQISLLVPFHSDGEHGWRDKDWKWLKRYWKKELPGAEIVIGHDRDADVSRGIPFSKTNAINNAAERCHGDIIVILDADCYIPGSVITHCAERIRSARNRGVRLWFVPYRHIYRLTKKATERLLASPSDDPFRFPEPPDPNDVEDTSGSLFGHKFGALIMIMPREGFETVGCMDPRFRGWGGEDVSFLRALDTLWVKHKNTSSDVLHLFHPRVGLHGKVHNPHPANWQVRVWPGQDRPRANDGLASAYNRATDKPALMRELVDSGCPTMTPPKLLAGIWHFFTELIRRVYDWFVNLFFGP